MSLFTNISGRFGEDIATEIVAYMLSNYDAYVPFQKLFFKRVIGKMVNSSELQVQTTTQPSFENGRPDFILWTRDAIIVIETKLGAYLSGDDQLARYCQVLLKDDILRKYFPLLQTSKLVNKFLVLLAPQSTIKLSEVVCDKLSKKNHNIIFREWCLNNKILYISLP